MMNVDDNAEAFKSFYFDACAERRRAGGARNRAQKGGFEVIAILCEVWLLWASEVYEKAEAATYHFGAPASW